jgi:hypothetical protein
MKSIPIPNAELQLNGEDLITQGREDKKDLLTGDTGIMTKLDALTYDKLSELQANKAENEMKMLQHLPMPAKYNLFIG